MMKNVFYFIIKASFVLKIFTFLTQLFNHVEKRLYFIKDRLISIFMMSQTEALNMAIYILLNISRSTDNEVMKFGPLVEYNMGNIFLEKSYAKSSGETIPRPFSKKSKSMDILV